MFSSVESMFSSVELKFSSVEYKFGTAEHNFLHGKDTILPRDKQEFFRI